MGHEGPFPWPWRSARYRFSQGTFAETRGNWRDAPIADLAVLLHNRTVLTRSSHWQTQSGGGVKPPNSLSINSSKAIVERSWR